MSNCKHGPHVPGWIASLDVQRAAPRGHSCTLQRGHWCRRMRVTALFGNDKGPFLFRMRSCCLLGHGSACAAKACCGFAVLQIQESPSFGARNLTGEGCFRRLNWIELVNLAQTKPTRVAGGIPKIPLNPPPSSGSQSLVFRSSSPRQLNLRVWRNGVGMGCVVFFASHGNQNGTRRNHTDCFHCQTPSERISEIRAAC